MEQVSIHLSGSAKTLAKFQDFGERSHRQFTWLNRQVPQFGQIAIFLDTVNWTPCLTMKISSPIELGRGGA